MENKSPNWWTSSALSDFHTRITAEYDNYDEIFVFWDLNETVLSPRIGFNCKLENAYCYVNKFRQGFDEETSRRIKNKIHDIYYSNPLCKVICNS